MSIYIYIKNPFAKTSPLDTESGESEPMNATSYPRAVLTEQEAAEIYQYRKVKKTHRSGEEADILHGKSAAVAAKYNISPKAVRDIWNRRTWTQVTRHLWTCDEKPMVRSNIARPRQSRLGSDSSESTVSRSHKLSSSFIMLNSEVRAITSRDDSCSIYEDDHHSINQFLEQAMAGCSFEFISTGRQSTDFVPARPQRHEGPPMSSCPSMSSRQPADARSAALHAASEHARNGAWEAEWGDGPLSAGAMDPFSNDWPHW